MYQSYRRSKQTDALQWLNQDGRGASIVATAHVLMELERHVRSVLPAPLNAACQVLRWQDGILTLNVPTAAHSAKLRQVTPRLASALQASGWQVNEIRLRVQARTSPDVPRIAPQPRPEITPDGVAAFAHLHEELRGGPLAEAVARLLSRRGAATTSDGSA